MHVLSTPDYLFPWLLSLIVLSVHSPLFVIWVQLVHYLKDKDSFRLFGKTALNLVRNRIIRGSAFDEQRILSRLPSRLVTDIIWYRNHLSINSLRILQLFNNRSIVAYLFNKMTSVYLNAGLRCLHQGDPPTGLVMITQGQLELFCVDGSEGEKAQEWERKKDEDATSTSSPSSRMRAKLTRHRTIMRYASTKHMVTRKVVNAQGERIIHVRYKGPGDFVQEEALLMGDCLQYSARTLTQFSAIQICVWIDMRRRWC